MFLTAFVLLWLAHIRRLDGGDWLYRYAWASPTRLFEAYGAPGSPQRGLAIALELVLLWLAGERIHGIASLAQATAHALQQRNDAVRFARKHQPTICKKVSDEALSVKGAMTAVDECVRCFDFALELSDVRWAVLREPTLIAYLCALKLLLLALLLLAAPLAGQLGASGWSVLDPMVPLCLGLCLAGPLVSLLLKAAAANREVVQQREHLRQATDELAASLGNAADDVEYVQLRIKSCEALQRSCLHWPGGRSLGMAEPVLLICLLAAACALGFTS
eukprot:CAMPEP_0171211958 /NCGR_PEP_ID=MMETSP0790-20130122/29887_1 /TAXON_ID=2925 /ORGANISM="Alexandrium catenella, Strain OF101" /LENGTH=275 /DNA_ID=CAMNT_0011677631 /DNA_START=71 /DNA_END=895 /DNA_ORIENTATION=-